MAKKYVFFVVFLIIATAFVSIYLSSVPENKLIPSPAPAAGLNQNDKSTNSIELNNFRAFYFVVDNDDEIKLIPNFEEMLTSSDVYQKNSCKALINGGFYSTENEPIGYFASEGEVLSEFRTNRLFNGVLSLNQMGTIRITNTPPLDPLSWGVQTGPLLKENSNYKVLDINNDKPARRMVAGVNGKNELMFVALTGKASEFDGPYLGNLPEVLEEFEDKSGIILADAINLDGGSASAFIGDNDQLSEISVVGSFLCVY